MRQNYLRNQIINTLKGNSDKITEVIPLSKLLVDLGNVKNKNHFGKALFGLYLSGHITDIVAVLNQLKTEKGIVPKRIQADNGSEFISKEFDLWAL